MAIGNSSSQFSQNDFMAMKDCVPDYFIECLIALWIWRTIPFILAFIGTCGNILNIIVLSRLRTYSTSVFLLTLAISDLLFLWVGAVLNAIHSMTPIVVDDYVEIVCRLRKWMAHTTGTFSLWILVLLNIERLLFAKAPVFARKHLTPRNALISAGSTLLVLALLNGHLVVGLTIQKVPENITSDKSEVCVYISDEYRKFSVKIWSVIMLVLYTFLPACFILVSNINLATTLIGNRKRLNKKGNAPTLLLFILCTSFLVSTMPYCVFLVVKGTVGGIKGRALARLQLSRAIVHVLLDCNYSLNFFFYFATGTLFKREWKKLMNKLKERFGNNVGTN